jgi:hypothetical protein
MRVMAKLRQPLRPNQGSNCDSVAVSMAIVIQ